MAGRRAKAIYSTRRWQEVRLATLNAAEWRCVHCGRHATECHHRVPLADGGAAYDRKNIEAICRTCHMSLAPGSKLTPKVIEQQRAWKHRLRRLSQGG